MSTAMGMASTAVAPAAVGGAPMNAAAMNAAAMGAAAGGTGYSRVTVIGAVRRVDLVLPSDEPLGLLLPDLIELLHEPVGRPPRLRQLLDGTGEALPPEGTLASTGVLDGDVLRMVGVDDSPPAPIVHDVTEEVAEDLDGRPGRWSPVVRRWSATLVAAVLAGAGLPLARAVLPGRSGLVGLAVVAVLGAVAGVALSRWREPAGTAVLLCVAVVALYDGWALGVAQRWPAGGRWLLLAGVLSVLVALLGATTPLGRGGVVGGGVGAGLVALWGGGALARMPADRIAGVLAVVAVILLGLLPRLALTAAGLVRLDDLRMAGNDVARRDVRVALAGAHRGLVLAVCGVAGSAALSGWLLAARPTPWSIALACLLALLVASRGRTYPLIGEVLATWVCTAAIGAALLDVWLRRTAGPPVAPLVAVATGLVATLSLVAWTPSEHVLARARRLADRVEALLVIALVPVTIGVLGTYGRLLHTF